MRKKDDEKQRCIKNAVVHLILEEGFQGTSISKIAKTAGVSPATVYIYYENKEAMLREIYLEHAEHRIDYLLQSVSSNMAGEEIIEQLIRRYYFFIIEHKEVFHFIEQFSACPVLQSSCGLMKESTALNQLLNDLKKRQILNNFNNDNLNAILFSSVKMIALKTCETENMAMNRLNELIYIVQKALIKDY